MKKSFYLYYMAGLLGLAFVVTGTGYGCSERVEPAEPGAPEESIESEEVVDGSTGFPNVVVIVADDLGWADVGYHGSNIETPHIDTIIAEGIQIERFYATPLCGPTRKGLYTGRSPVSLGVINNPRPSNESQSVPLEEHLISESFKGAGYQTWMIGKWHLGGTTDERYLPNSRGFDHFYGFEAASIDSYTHRGWNPDGSAGEVDWQRNGETLDQEGYSTDLLTDEIVNTLIPGRDTDKPFFLMLAYNAVHTPLLGPEDLVEKYAEVFPEDEDRQTYAAMAERMDFNIGRVLAALKEAEIDERTLIFFISDNGGNTRNGGASNSPLRGWKGQVFEGGVRVAAGVRWPGVVQPGSVSNQFMSVLDLFPTLASAVGIEIQNDKNEYPLDGRNLWEELKGEAALKAPEEYLVVGSDGAIALFDMQWKLIKKREGSAPPVEMLFEIEQSPNEAEDVAELYPDIVEAMSERIVDITRDVVDQL
jgi:arylsulfatase B